MSPIPKDQGSVSPYLEKRQESGTGKTSRPPNSAWISLGWETQINNVWRQRLYYLNKAWRMIWCPFEFRSVSIERGTLGERSSCSCVLSLLPCLVPWCHTNSNQFPPISCSRTGVFSDIFSCLVVCDWLSSSYCLPTALHSISEQCHRWAKITGTPSLWVWVATEGVVRVDPQAISSHTLRGLF